MSQNSSSSSIRCTRCDDVLPAGFRPGLCPVCLMDVAMRPTHDDTLPVAPPQKPLSPEDLAPHFPQLEILECIGRGGMGVVYKARQKALGRLVALKLLAPEQKKDAAFAERFAHEARALAALNHPNIVTVHDFGESGGFYYLLMEFVDGVNLRQAMRGSHLSPEQALTIVPPICEALQYAHEHGIVHRDIKPENLLMDKAGRMKIADFGIAKMLSHEAAVAEDEQAAAGSPRSTVVAGTPQYMAPEQSSAAARADHRVDIYSLGVVLYELLTGELPAGRLQMPPQGAMTDVRLDEVVRRALEQDPEQRYQTVKELQTHLAALAAAPMERKVHSREKHERWFMVALRVAGWLCVLLGLSALADPVVSWRRMALTTTTFFPAIFRDLDAVLLFFAAAWLLIRHPRFFVRASYRPLIVPPVQGLEVMGIVTRLAGLALVGFGGVFLVGFFSSSLSWRWDNLILGMLLLTLGICVFRFEHAFLPLLHAVPRWRPQPFDETAAKRGISGHAVGGGLLLVLLLAALCWVGWGFSRLLAQGREWTVDMSAGVLVWALMMSCLAGITSFVGWAAVNLIRGSAGRLYGLGLAAAATAALPLFLTGLVLAFLLYGAVENRFRAYAFLPEGGVQVTTPNGPTILAGVGTAVGLACVVAWLGFWKKLRGLPAPVLVSQAPARPRFRGRLVAVMASLFMGVLVLLYFFMTRPAPPAMKIPVAQVARLVERQLNLYLFAAGYRHDLPQGSLKMPPEHRLMPLTLPGLKDDAGRTLKGSLSLGSTPSSVWILGDKAIPGMRLSVSRTTSVPLRREVVVPAPQNSARCLLSLRLGHALEASSALHERLQSPSPALTSADFAWMRENQADVVVQVEEDGVVLKLFDGAAVVVAPDSPSGFDWLTIDDRKLTDALLKACTAIPPGGGFTVVRERSPAVLVYATRKQYGLIENLGPSKPGAKDARLRISRLPNPFR